MKKFLIFLVLAVCFMIWLEDWTTSGKMDAFIEEHEDPDVTPKIIFLIGEACYTAQQSKTAAFYYRWLAEKYPKYPSMARARFHLAESYQEIGDRGKAIEQYIILKDSFSATGYGQSAKRKWELSRF